MCSKFGIRDFPILNSVPVTRNLNASIYEEIPLDIQWAPKATEPKFIYDGPYANLGYLEYMDTGPSTTTLRLNGNTFKLISVQLCVAQHASLLESSKQRDCSGELVIGFKASTSISESYVFLCVPIVTRPTTTVSPYLEALRLGRLDGKPTSLLTVLPQDKHFISYSTCLQRTESSGSVPKQTRVFVFTEGLTYPLSNFQDICRKITASAVSGPIFLPAIQLPDNLKDKTEALLFSIATETDYKSLLRYSLYYPTGVPDSSRYRKDSLDAYKCVPLEPSQNIKDGQITVDTENGTLLSQVMQEKQEAGQVTKGRITPALVEKVIAIGIALVLIAFIFLILAYIIASITTPNADSFFKVIKQNSGTIGPIVFFSILSAVLAFVIGFFLSTWV
jgi:hypothetical protein